MSPADIIRKRIIDTALGTTPTNPPGTWPAYTNHYPDTPHEVLFLTDTAPILDGRESRGGKTILHHGVQVVVRAREHTVGWAKAEALVAMFDAIQWDEVTIAPDTYRLEAVHHRGIVAMGQEPDKRRSMYSLNLVITYHTVTA